MHLEVLYANIISIFLIGLFVIAPIISGSTPELVRPKLELVERKQHQR